MNVDKSILKVAGIISIVVGIICCLTILGAIFGIPLIIGGSKINKISKLSDNEILNEKDTILVWAIVFIFLNFISGILCILYYLSITNENNNGKYQQLEKLKKLYDEKEKNKEEYEKEKSKILNK